MRRCEKWTTRSTSNFTIPVIIESWLRDSALVVLQSEDFILAEADMGFHAQPDLPEFPFGALKQGEYLTMKVFVAYYLRGDRICRFKTALWPANFGVTEPPIKGFGPKIPDIPGTRAEL